MKIASVRADVYSCPFQGVAVTQGVGNMVKRDLVLIRVSAEDGTVGYGESHMGLNPTAIAEVVNHSMAPQVVGQDVFDAAGIWERVYRHQIVTHGLGAGSTIAFSGIDIALWDLRGKLLEQPVYRLLGGRNKSIRAYAGGMGLGWQDKETLATEVKKYVDVGYTAVKLRVGEGVDIDAERVSHVREAIGNGVDIALDAATRYRLEDMGPVLQYAEANRVLWLEEPITPDDVQGYAEIRRSTWVPIAAGENHYTRQAFRDLFTARAITICQADCTKAGGLSETMKIADMASAWHLRMAPHLSQSIISTAANVHLLCALPNAMIYEADISRINPWRDDLARNPLRVVDGYIQPNDEPGLGLDIDESILEQYPAIPGSSYVPASP